MSYLRFLFRAIDITFWALNAKYVEKKTNENRTPCIFVHDKWVKSIVQNHQRTFEEKIVCAT